MDFSTMDLETSTKFWEELQNLMNDTILTSPLQNANYNGMEIPSVQEENEKTEVGHMNSQGSESGSSSTLSLLNNELMSILCSAQQNEQFHTDEEMVGYDLEVFGLRWKLENIQGIHQNEIRLLKVLVPYNNNGLPIFTKIENDVVADNNNEEEIKQGNTNLQFLISDFLDNFNYSLTAAIPSGNDSETYVTNEPSIVNKESKIEAEIILPGPKLIDEEIKTGSAIESSKSEKLTSKIDVISSEPNNLKMKKFEPRTVKCFPLGSGSPSADAQWAKKFNAKKSFHPTVNVNGADEVIFKSTASKSMGGNFVCEFCNNSYNQKYKWKNHVKIHCGEVTYKCDCINCKVPYRDYRTMRKHHNERTRKML